MIEFVLAWIMVFVGFVKLEAEWFIASGIFAIASQIYDLRKHWEKDNG